MQIWLLRNKWTLLYKKAWNVNSLLNANSDKYWDKSSCRFSIGGVWTWFLFRHNWNFQHIYIYWKVTLRHTYLYRICAWVVNFKCFYAKSENREKWNTFSLFDDLFYFWDEGGSCTNSKNSDVPLMNIAENTVP